MSNFFKITIRNLLKGPVTDPYPFGETFTPDKLRGKPIVDATKCTACKICEEVCPSSAIKIVNEDKKYVHIVWYNTCCFCGNCEYFCPTGAIKLTNDFHTANTKEEKYSFFTTTEIEKIKCEGCGEYFMPASQELVKRAYPTANENMNDLFKLCPKCRQKKSFKRLYKK